MSVLFPSTTGYPNVPSRMSNGDPDDMWDFGTVRHSGKTIGRSSVRAAGPPLTWENDGREPEEYSGSRHKNIGSGGSIRSYSTAKNVGSSAPRDSPRSSQFEPDTVRTAQNPVAASAPRSPVKSHHSVREPSEEYDDYDDQYEDDYTAKLGAMQSKAEDLHLDDDLPDTTMLDSVVLPAIASVSSCLLVVHTLRLTIL